MYVYIFTQAFFLLQTLIYLLLFIQQILIELLVWARHWRNHIVNKAKIIMDKALKSIILHLFKIQLLNSIHKDLCSFLIISIMLG